MQRTEHIICKSKNYRKEETVKEDKQLLIVHSV